MAKASEKASVMVWGKHSIETLLTQQENGDISWDSQKRNKCRLYIWKTKNAGPIDEDKIYSRAALLGWRIDICPEGAPPWPLDKKDSVNHQRYCVALPEVPTSNLQTAEKILKASQEEGITRYLGLVLDHLEDPYNFGAIIRTAAFLNLKFIIYPQNRQAGLTGAVFKASAGGAFMLNMIPVVNISRAITDLKMAGGWVVGGTVSNDSIPPEELPLDRPLVLVVGNENKGISRECLKHLDYKVKIPGGLSTLDSLNVGVATGILLYTQLNRA